jgi:hypothetical protein
MEGWHTHVDLNNQLVLDEIQKRKNLMKMGYFHFERCDFNNTSIGIILNHENRYFYEDKDTRFDCVWEELVEQDSIRQDSKKCKDEPIFRITLSGAK